MDYKSESVKGKNRFVNISVDGTVITIGLKNTEYGL
jgi:hypothetical protein